MLRITLVCVLLLLPLLPMQAGVYSTFEPCPFEEFPEGLARPLGYSNFKILLTEVLRNDPRAGDTETKNRQELIARVTATRQRDFRALSAEQRATHTADLIRLGGPYLDEALNQLQPLANQRRGDFFVLSHLARIHQDRQEWDSAFQKHYSAVLDMPFPRAFPGYNAEQMAWVKRVESKFNLQLLRSRKQEAEQKRTGVQEDVDAIFPLRVAGKEWSPVQFRDASGNYSPGQIAPEESDKLPEDAIAIAQQLVLWNPHDPRLYWLLAELYNARGEVANALQLMDECVSSPRNYSNRLLMERRAILRSHQDAIAAQARQLQEAERAAAEDRLALRLGVVVGVILVFVIFQIRELRRRLRKRL